ncbi:hypothetical protein GOV14_01985 [Candidatus Pacearchaeota archaeon]|nr:hypothetical protein [Candidatus Pacearchaeota archaeon]
MNLKDKVMKQASEWNPQFTWVDSALVCADLINQPHEDYPHRIEKTMQTIDNYVNMNKMHFSEFNLRQANSYIMWDQQSRGQYRKHSVDVGNHTPPDAIHVPALMTQILPIYLDPVSEGRKDEDNFRLITNRDDLIKWYSILETIHPYSDGNGRVGGAIVGAASKIMFDRYLAPIGPGSIELLGDK